MDSTSRSGRVDGAIIDDHQNPSWNASVARGANDEKRRGTFCPRGGTPLATVVA
jgi:hypothetical protein